MTDYSPLFWQGLLAVQEHPVHIRINPRQQQYRRQISKHAQQGRSFLSFHVSFPTEDSRSSSRSLRPLKRLAPSSPSKSINASTHRYGSTSSDHSRSTQATPSSPTSPSRRNLPLPKPKPAPIACLPAIPSPSMHSRTQSAVPSSIIASRRRSGSISAYRKTAADAVLGSHGPGPVRRPSTASTSTMSSAMSTQYRKRRRLDALLALEGRRPTAASTLPRSGLAESFVPTMVQEEDEATAEVPEDTSRRTRYIDEATAIACLRLRSHLSFSSWYTAVTSPLVTLPITAGPGTGAGSWTTTPSTFDQSPPDTFKTPSSSFAFPPLAPMPEDVDVDPSVVSISLMDLFDPSLPPLPPRRKSEPAESSHGWGETFIDLDAEDDGSSFWRWSTHLA